MGQQQLLLLVLGIVIVGLAVVVGIQAFSENQKKANADALVNDAIRITSDLQAWKLKPQAFGGGADATGFTGASLQQMGYQLGTSGCAATEYGNLNGCFTLDLSDVNAPVITGVSSANTNQVTVTVTGTTPSDITTTVDTNYSGSSS